MSQHDLVIDDVTYCYQPNPPHRNLTPGKSQWTVNLNSELGVFKHSIVGEWGAIPYYWGLHRVLEKPVYLGVDRDHSTELFLARFEKKTADVSWHGYPVNHRDGKPSREVLRKWMDEKILRPALITKIMVGKPCAL